MAAGIVTVGVHQDQALPRTELGPSPQDRDGHRRAYERRKDVVGAVALGPVPMTVAIVARQQSSQGHLQIVLRTRADLDEGKSGRGVGDEGVDHPVTELGAEPIELAGQIDEGPAGGVDGHQGGVHFAMIAPRDPGCARRSQYGRGPDALLEAPEDAGASRTVWSANVRQVSSTLQGDRGHRHRTWHLPRVPMSADRVTGQRCPWADGSDAMRRYHDDEWGVPSHDDRHLFEFLILEGAQAGLSWSTILNKREGYRQALDAFDPERIARYDEAKLAELLGNPGIVRNRLKVRGTVSNASAFLQTCDEFGVFAAYLWDWVDGKPIVNRPRTMADLPARSELSDRLGRDLKRRGFTFVGSTIVYAYLQAVGVVNDHLASCPAATRASN